MVARHTSMRGEVIDMNRMRDINATKPALGNANRNARGDMIGPGGVVLKTQEQIVAEWAANKARIDQQSKPADIKSSALIPDSVPMAAPIPKQVNVDDQDFDPAASQIAKPSRRKITETDA